MLSDSFTCRYQILIEGLTDCLQPLRVADFSALFVGHVKNVRHLIDIGRYLGQVDSDPELMHSVGDREENPNAILGVYLNNGKLIRGLIVDVNNRGDFGRPLLKERWAPVLFH